MATTKRAALNKVGKVSYSTQKLVDTVETYVRRVFGEMKRAPQGLPATAEYYVPILVTVGRRKLEFFVQDVAVKRGYIATITLMCSDDAMQSLHKKLLPGEPKPKLLKFKLTYKRGEGGFGKPAFTFEYA